MDLFFRFFEDYILLIGLAVIFGPATILAIGCILYERWKNSNIRKEQEKYNADRNYRMIG